MITTETKEKQVEIEASELSMQLESASIAKPSSQSAVEALKGHPLIAKLLTKENKTRIKIGISVILFASLFIFGKVDLSKSWQVALNADKTYLIWATAIFLGSVFLNAHRWQLLADAIGLKKPLLQLVQYCYVGMFFNLFLPSTVGGDVSRCYYVSKGTGKYVDAFYSVLADRALGISILFLMATAGILLGPGGSGLPWELKWPIFAGTLFVFCFLPLMPWFCKTFLGESNWITKQLTKSPAAVYWQSPGLIFVCLIWSLLLQVLIVGCHIAIGWALGLNQVPIWYYFVFYPSVAVLGFITPSFNGIGIREWAYTYFLKLMGVDNDHGVTYAIMWLGLITFSSLVGGLVYLLGHFQKPPEQIENMDSLPLS
jgi:uncharacterized membrane protein YbhN (UPF0104 family)